MTPRYRSDYPQGHILHRHRDQGRLFVIAFILLLLLLSFSSCGGGTIGTGGTGSSKIAGNVKDEDDVPISDATVTLEETGDSTQSKGDGSFALESKITAESVTLLVETTENQARTKIDEIPPGAQDIDVTLELNRRSNTVSVKKKKITARPTATAVPQPTATVLTPIPSTNENSTPEPSTDSTPLPTETEGTPVPTETPSVIATEVPTVAPTAAPSRLTTLFIGTLLSSDPNLIADARVGIPGKGFVDVNADGSFQFRELASDQNTLLAVRTGGRGDRASLSGVTADTRRVNLRLRIETTAQGRLRLTVEYAEIINRRSLESPTTLPD